MRASSWKLRRLEVSGGGVFLKLEGPATDESCGYSLWVRFVPCKLG